MGKRKAFFAAICIFIFSSSLCGCIKTVPNNQNETTKSTQTTQKIENTTQSTTTQITEKSIESTLNAFSKEEIKALNVFLSNFSEVNMNSYSFKDGDNYIILYFSFTHNKINTSRLKYENGYEYIEYSDANETSKKYFGKELKRQSENEYTYKNNRFYLPSADGESYAYVSVATGFFEKENDVIEVPFKAFSYNDPHPSKEEYDAAFPGAYASSYGELSNNPNWSFEYDGTATVKRKTYNGKNTYELLEYKTFK